MGLAVAVFAVALSAWRPLPAGIWHDDGVYMLVGRALADGHGFTYQGVVGAPPAVKFPPVYPLFVAALWWLFGSAGAVTLAATLANLVFLALAAAGLAFGLRRVGLPLGLALAAGGLPMLSADVLRTTSAVLSEPLFMMWIGAAFAVWPAASDPSRGGRARALLAALLLLAIATRAAGLAFVVGFGVAAWVRLGPGRAAAIAGPAIGVWIAWTRWAGAKGRAIPEELADLLGPYSGWMREQVAADPAGFVARMPAHAFGVFERMAVLLLPRASGAPLWIGGAAVLLLAAYGAVVAARRYPPLVWSGGAYAGLLLLWPYLDRRLVVPLHMVLLAAMAVGGLSLWRSVQRPPARRVVLGLMLAWCGYYGVLNVVRIGDGWPTAGYRLRAERLATAVEALSTTAPQDAVVGAPEFWAGLHLHGGWTVTPSTLFDPASTDAEAPSWGSPEAQERLWRLTGVQFLVLEQGGLLNGATLDRLEARCPGGVEVVAHMPPMYLVRVDLGPGCPPAG